MKENRVLTQQEETILSIIDADELVQLTRDLVQIDSVIRPETGNTESKVVRFIAEWIEKNLDITPLIQEVEPGRENIVATIDSGTPGRCLMFEGHTDVVSEGDPKLWKHHPFSADVENGRIYGRGSCDMKAGLAVNLIVCKALIKSRTPWSGKIQLGIVCDEEGMMIGIKDFIGKGHADDVDACLVSEPEENQLCLSMKGAIRAVVHVHGRMAHGAMPLSGINPNTRLARIILAYEGYEQAEKERCGEDPYLGYPSITFTVVQSPPAGEPAQLNVMPGSSEAFIDIRTVPDQDHEKIKRDLQEILHHLSAEDGDFDADITFIEERPVVSMTREEPIVRCAASAGRDITGKEPIYNGVPGATDGTWLRALKNIPSLVNGPGPRTMPHQVDEYIDIDELIESAKIYAVTSYRFLNNKE